MLRYMDLVDYILGVLYTQRKKFKHGYFSLQEIVNNLDYPSTSNEIIDIGKFLEADGFVRTTKTLGDVFVEITSTGIVYIERKGDAFMHELEDYLEQKRTEKNFNNIASSMTNTSISQSRKPIIKQISDIILQLSNFSKNSDGHLDARILKLELQKRQPDREVLMIKLENLMKYSEIRTNMNRLRNYLTHYLEY